MSMLSDSVVITLVVCFGCKGSKFSSDLQIFRRFPSKIGDCRDFWGKSSCGNAAKVANSGKGIDRDWAVCILDGF